MSQIEVSRISEFVAVGSPAGHVNVSRMSIYAIMKPGEDDGGEATANRQSFVYGQRIRRG